MHRFVHHGLQTLSILFVLSAASVFAAEPLRFNRDIRPILADKCFACHGFDAKARKADLRLDLRESALAAQAIVPGQPAASSVVERIKSRDPQQMMPPPKSHKKLSSAEQAMLERWIAAGAPYEKHWSFELPQRAAPPTVQRSDWVRNPVDAFVLAGLESAGLAPAPEADRRTLARRLSLDLTGLPPQPEVVEKFVADPAPDAYDRLIEHFMNSQQWGEHRGRYWLDAARYGDTHGIHHDAYREIWPYRDWVIAAFNRNQRFDEFTVEQIAGDLLPNPRSDQLIATGFHRCNITTAEGGTIAEENLAMYANDRVTTTSWVWLGLTANCAACHDHKFDPITMKDFYSLAAYFRNTTQGAMDGNVKDTKPVLYLPQTKDEARFKELPQCIAATTTALGQRRTQEAQTAATWAREVSVEQFGMSRRGWVDPKKPTWSETGPLSVSARIKLPKDTKDGRIVAADGGELFVQGKRFGLRVGNKLAIVRRDLLSLGKEHHLLATFDGQNRFQLYLDGKENESERKDKQPAIQATVDAQAVTDVQTYARVLSKLDAQSLFDEPKLRTTLAIAVEKRTPQQTAALVDFYFHSVDETAVSLAAELDALQAEDAEIRARATVTHVQEEKPGEAMANILMRGAYDKVGEKVTPAGFSALHAMPADAPKNRLGLARWLVSAENPLTARVTVNRFWQELFGTGLVRTAEDFGAQGEPPVNQALLDWLAVEFRESGWDVKQLFTLLVKSNTYRQSAQVTSEKLARDPQNRLLSRGPRFRMDAEMVRDYALAASGTLSLKMGGPGTKPYQPSNIWEVVGLHGARYTQDKGENLYRRTIYNFWKRQAPSPNMETFNAPSREVCTVRRERTNTPLQALVTLNDPQFVEAARRLAESVLQQKTTPAEIVGELSRRILLRPLSPAELTVVLSTASDLESEFSAHPERATAYVQIGDTKPDASLSAPRLATYGMIASQLLNLDEALNK